jgi:predicted transposase/invertase (TIGR01784 family)
MLTKFLDPKNFLAFEHIFGSEENKDILIHFLNDIFGRTISPIREVTFLKAADPAIALQKVSNVDVLCEDLKGKNFVVQLGVFHNKIYFEKMAIKYANKVYIEPKQYTGEVQEVRFLAITPYEVFPSQKSYLSHLSRSGMTLYDNCPNEFSFSFLELPKFSKPKERLSTLIEKWTYFFKYAFESKEEDLEMIAGSDYIIWKAYEALNRFSWTGKDLLDYDSMEMKQAADKEIHEDWFNHQVNNCVNHGLEIQLVENQQCVAQL